jgi:16S rRNA G966 N2-methylase RsmD
MFVKFDQKFNKDPGYVFYDFNKPEEIPADLHQTFDMIVIDPPFITREVWEKVKQINMNINIVC